MDISFNVEITNGRMNVSFNVPHDRHMNELVATASHDNGSRSALFDEKASMESEIRHVRHNNNELVATASHDNGSRSALFDVKASMESEIPHVRHINNDRQQFTSHVNRYSLITLTLLSLVPPTDAA
jgi:hypothetical protein